MTTAIPSFFKFYTVHISAEEAEVYEIYYDGKTYVAQQVDGTDEERCNIGEEFEHWNIQEIFAMCREQTRGTRKEFEYDKYEYAEACARSIAGGAIIMNKFWTNGWIVLPKSGKWAA